MGALLNILPLFPTFGQFSPGDLSRAHEALEGSQNCTQCHEVGKEISGKKCLACHDEIQSELNAKEGFHFRSMNQTCTACHKEHLGRTARTYSFEPKKFEHTSTGFTLAGKHLMIGCQDCHSPAHIRNAVVTRKSTQYPHDTYLGLSAACVSCHADPHKNKFGQDCSSCHTSVNWQVSNRFDHSRTSFALEGKHAEVACAKCHPGIDKQGAGKEITLAAKSFADCTPCHTSPHLFGVNEMTCSSCHAAQGWELALEKPFDHRQTRYRLVGKHQSVRCEQCHSAAGRTTFAQRFLLSFRKCTDCHTDKHHGEFVKRYNNDCALCHTESGYRPSTFTLVRHSQSRFALTGAHQALLCDECHLQKSDNVWKFHLSSLRCESCHEDVHKGQFAAEMNGASCEKCHSTDRWSTGSFDHSRTSFPLTGKHATAACSDCHKGPMSRMTGSRQFQKISGECESCHKDAHVQQFAVEGKTSCERCHQPDGWKSLLFNHETQSRFSLSGAHKKVACTACHHTEQGTAGAFVRFKPLEVSCAACHKGKDPR